MSTLGTRNHSLPIAEVGNSEKYIETNRHGAYIFMYNSCRAQLLSTMHTRFLNGVLFTKKCKSKDICSYTTVR